MSERKEDEGDGRVPFAQRTLSLQQPVRSRVDLAVQLRCFVPTLQDVPPFMRPTVRMALVYTESHTPDVASASRVWKLFLLASRMFLARTAHRTGAPRVAVTRKRIPTG